MSYAPASLTALGAYLVSKGVVNLGIVGNAAHTRGYHLGRDRIYGVNGIGDADYSVQRARDRTGLTNAASALDIGKVNGTIDGLRELSKWLIVQCQAGRAPDIREVIYSPDGVTVYRWESSDNVIRTGPGQGDNSHLTHTHISYYRDSEARGKIAVFAPYWETTMRVGFKPVDPPIGPGAFVLGAGHALIEMASAGAPDRKLFLQWPGGSRNFVVIAGVNLTRWADGAPVDIEGNSPPLLHRDEVYIVIDEGADDFGGPTYTLRQDGVYTAAPDSTPYAQAQLDAAQAAGVVEGKAIGTVTGTALEKARVRSVLGI
jgi:hypothetical protein